jgi:hypothetical protein
MPIGAQADKIGVLVNGVYYLDIGSLISGMVFNPASPGTIGGTTPGIGNFSQVSIGSINPFSYHALGTIGSTATFNANTAVFQDGTLTASTNATITLSNIPTSPELPVFLHLIMPASNVPTLTFSSTPAITWANGSPVLPAANGSLDLKFYSNGTVLYGWWASSALAQANLGLIAGTLTDGYLCTYTASGTLLSCNTAPYTLAGLGGASSASPTFTGTPPILPGAPSCPTYSSTSTGTGNVNIDGASYCDYHYADGASAVTYTPVITAPPGAGVRYITLTIGGGSGVVTKTWTNVTFWGTAGSAASITNKFDHYCCIVPASGNAICSIIAEGSTN